MNQISSSEKYIYDWLIDDNKSKYSYKIFIHILRTEINDLGLATNLKIIILLLLGLLLVVLIPILQMAGVISYEYYSYLLVFGFFISIFIIFKSIIKERLNLDYNMKGFKEHCNVLGFYNFIKDFSLLSELEIKHYPLWKEYLEFAILFNLNNKFSFNERIQLLTKNEILETLEEFGDNA